MQTALERTSKKYDLQLRQLKDTEKREKFKVYGELTQTYGYGLEPKCKIFNLHELLHKRRDYDPS